MGFGIDRSATSEEYFDRFGRTVTHRPVERGRDRRILVHRRASGQQSADRRQAAASRRHIKRGSQPNIHRVHVGAHFRQVGDTDSVAIARRVMQHCISIVVGQSRVGAVV